MPYLGDHLRQLLLPFNILTSRYRTLPDFVIVGAQRSGTTSLYRYLSEHPDIIPAIKKEIHYFDLNYEKGLNWYRRHFPLRKHRDFLSKIRGVNVITGEASPYYLYHSLVPNRIYSTIPDVKIVIMLRNPVDRAYSHYFHEKRLGKEKLSFEDAIRNESERVLSNRNGGDFSHQHYSYLSRGKYIEQIKRYFEVFLKDNILIIESEDFFNNTDITYSNVLEFLGVETYKNLSLISVMAFFNYFETRCDKYLFLGGSFLVLIMLNFRQIYIFALIAFFLYVINSIKVRELITVGLASLIYVGPLTIVIFYKLIMALNKHLFSYKK